MGTVFRAALLGLAAWLVTPMVGIGAVPVSRAGGAQGSVSRHALAGAAQKHRHKKPTKPVHKQHRKPLPVQVKVAVGYQEQYRSGAWVPVRITLRNRTNGNLSGTVEVPDQPGTQNMPPQPYHTQYEQWTALPAGASKVVTLYLPGADLQNGVQANFRSPSGLLGHGEDDNAYSFDQSTLSIALVSGDPSTTSWVLKSDPANNGSTMIRLAPTSLDTLPQALANWDTIVLSNVATGSMSHAQLTALDGYVHNGGGLILVGGPDWQETLSGLPASLLPGHLAGARTLPDLHGLSALDGRAPPRAQTTVAVLSHPRGDVLAEQSGVPLVVDTPVGSGQVVFLAFDPSAAPMAGWKGASRAMAGLVRRSVPMAMARIGLPQGMNQPGGFTNNFGPPLDVGTELANVPSAALPSVVLFAGLTILYILLLGPVNFLVLRRLRRRELAWVTVPAVAVLCMATTFGVAFHLKGDTVLVNTLGVLQLDGSDGPHPLAQYVGLFAPVRGDYDLQYGAPALASQIPQFQYYGPGPNGSNASSQLGLRFAQDGSRTNINFVSMNMWSMRSVAIHSMTTVKGTVHAQLHLDRKGWIVGAVHNDTTLTFVRPMIVAGQTVLHLKDLPPEGTEPVRVKPDSDIFDYSNQPFWWRVYGQPQFGGCCWGGPRFFGGGATVVSFAMGGGGCCYGPNPPKEKTIADRIRNAVADLPEAQGVSALGDVLFVGWSEQALGQITVDGATPQRRDLTMAVEPLSVAFPRGQFTLRPGVLAARVVDGVPQQSSNGCCAPAVQPLYLGEGGWATLEWDVPDASHVHFTKLSVGLNAGGAMGTSIGKVYDWRTGRWDHIDLSWGYARLKDPARYVGPHGQVLLHLSASWESNDIHISDIHRYAQLTGSGALT